MPVKSRINKNSIPRKCRAFSVSEVVVAMAIIIMLSVLGFLACNVGLHIENTASRLFYLQSGAENTRAAFVQTLNETGGVTQEEEGKKNFILAFNHRLAFALNSFAPNMRGLSEHEGYGVGQTWNIRLINKSRTEWVSEVGEDGRPQVYEKIIPIEGLDVDYNGSSARFVFTYRFYTELYELRIGVNLLHGDWRLTVKGYGPESSHSSYEWEGSYQ